MAIKYEPSKLIKKLDLKDRAADLVTANGSVNRSAIKALADMGVLPRKALESTAIKVIRQYKDKAEQLRAEGATRAEATEESVNDAKLMQARVQSAALYEQTRLIQKAYKGERYEWLPSTAANPREEHVANYYKIFILGEGDDNGDDPGDLYGCQCGMRILVDETPAEFEQRLEDEA